MAQKGPGKAHREGIGLIELTEMFPDEAAATAWFESLVWPEGRHCPRCGCTETHEAAETSGLPYYCSGCKRAFSVRIGTALERSKVPLRKWVFAIYLEMVSLKGVSSMRLHRDLKVTQKTAWFMLHRIREAWADEAAALFTGPAEVDETFIGGKRKNMPKAKRKQLKGRGGHGKAVVAGVKDRGTNRIVARPVEATDGPTLQGFVREHVEPGAQVFTDDARAYRGMAGFDHESVNHSVGEYVRKMAHTNGIESFWSLFKRGYHGTFHHLSEKHLARYVREFAGRHNVRNADTVDQMAGVVTGLVGKRLMYRDLIA
ncbi:MAG: IS1595 family transposase [Rhodospirillaceae bacterium]|nr:IS1595 family transposase [Rhodospirillaceae bacterium]MYB12460.1 IS1595 family transposase [Rhodospirillaceae bacterium]MYI51112.1 IS1595 family transposase [Rhodospirillaceae bacterium]